MLFVDNENSSQNKILTDATTVWFVALHCTTVGGLWCHSPSIYHFFVLFHFIFLLWENVNFFHVFHHHKYDTRSTQSPLWVIKIIFAFFLPAAGTTISTAVFQSVGPNNVCHPDTITKIEDLSNQMQKFSECQTVCAKASQCVAITFWKDKKYCTLYSKFCDTPFRKGKDRDVYRKRHAIASEKKKSDIEFQVRKFDAGVYISAGQSFAV